MGTTGRSRRELTLLHTADLHIGNPDHPDAALGAFEGVLQVARDARADAILVAGDLFDVATVPRAVIEYVFAAFERMGRPVVIVPGNHDTLLTNRDSPFHGLATNNVRVLSGDAGETFALERLGLTLWGRPVYSHDTLFHPLEGLPARPDDGWYVAMAHGIVTDGVTFRERASPIHDGELALADSDYIALGHVHQYREVTQGPAIAYYSGSPSVGASASTAAIVHLDPTAGVRVARVEVPRLAHRLE